MRSFGSNIVRDDTIEKKNVTVGTSITTVIEKQEIYGMKGNFAVDNTAGANDITVYPRVSTDGSTWFELDNGSGATVVAGGKKVFPFTGNYRYVKLDAVASVSTTGVNAWLYISSL